MKHLKTASLVALSFSAMVACSGTETGDIAFDDPAAGDGDTNTTGDGDGQTTGNGTGDGDSGGDGDTTGTGGSGAATGQSGGATSSGGANNSGGSSNSGGSANSGGSSSSGGSDGSGGAVSSGGSDGSGGSVSSGGTGSGGSGNSDPIEKSTTSPNIISFGDINCNGSTMFEELEAPFVDCSIPLTGLAGTAYTVTCEDLSNQPITCPSLVNGSLTGNLDGVFYLSGSVSAGTRLQVVFVASTASEEATLRLDVPIVAGQ